jgi:hypothetical protein
MAQTMRTLGARSAVQLLVAVVIYAAYAIFVTWPVVLDLDGSIFGPLDSDLMAGIAHTREVVQEGGFPFAPMTLHDFNAPFGLEEQWVLNIASAPGTALLYGPAYVVGATASHTLFVLFGFVLSGTAMFLLARRLTGSAPVAIVAGFAFAFYPFAINKGLVHVHYTHGWLLVLVAWRMIELTERPSLRNGLLAGAAAALAMWFTPYFILIVGVEFAVLAVVVAAVGWAGGTLRRTAAGLAAASAVVVALVVSLGVLEAVTGGDAGGLRTHSLATLSDYSARVRELILPDRNNLLVGSRTGPRLAANLHGSNFGETSLYVGLSVLALALAGAGATGARLWRRRREALTERPVVGGLAAAAAALAGLAFAAPPQVSVGGTLVPFPAWFVYQLTSTWRAYSRFIVLIMLGLCLLAAIGLAAALAGRRPPARAAILVVLAVIVPLDLWARPRDAVHELGAPPLYGTLERQPGGNVAEYPIQPVDLSDARPLAWQEAHGHPVLQGFPGDDEAESRKLELRDLADPETPAGLAALGVRYVVLWPDEYRGTGGPPPEGRGLERLTAQDGAVVYRVTADAARSQVDGLAGFGLPQGPPEARYRWANAAEARLLVLARCGSCRGVLVFRSTSRGTARRLEVVDAAGRVVQRRRIPVGRSVPVRAPLRFSRRTEVVLRTTPGPAAPPQDYWWRDTRALTITVERPRFLIG